MAATPCRMRAASNDSDDPSPARGVGDGTATPADALRGPKGPARTAPKPRPGDELELAIERVDARGRPCGRARHATGEYAVVLRRGAIGARVRVEVLRRRGERVEDRKSTRLNSSH